jgi:signal recognition particle subunit SRP54
MREIRLALLEADVNFRVVKDFVATVRERALGQDVLKSLTPGQQVVKIVHEELTALMGSGDSRLVFAPRPPTVILLAGLQGSGKTTTAAKLALLLRKEGKKPALVPADLQRPAAIDQLEQLGKQIQIPVYRGEGDPVAVSAAGVQRARDEGRDVVIVDTAGRLAIDGEMMEQVRQVSATVQPDYTFLVVDAMTGQDAVTVAEAFNETLAIDGVILSKLDGDARGGAALSVKEVIGKPIAFASTGEKLADFEQFHPDRMASRILGMGDVLSLIEKAEEVYEKDEAEAAAAKLLEGDFTLDDFLDQMQQLKKMGPLSSVIGMIPGLPKEARNAEIHDDQLKRVEAIIRSMTLEERRKPDLVNGSRRLRIANGSGTTTAEVNALLKQFKDVQKMMKRMGGLGSKKGKRRMPMMPNVPSLN